MYAEQRKRSDLEKSAPSLEEFLQQLDVKVSIKNANDFTIPRISQLTLKTNQFNLTTRRYTEADCEAFMKDKNTLAFTVRLSDRFGDHGLISVIIARLDGKVAIVDTWLMSCRVLKIGRAHV